MTSAQPEAGSRADMIQTEYDALRGIAAARMRNERDCHTLTGTALVHEVAAKILDNEETPTDNRGQFLAFAKKAMQHYLIDYARTKGRQKRGGDRNRVVLQDVVLEQPAADEISGIADILARLARHDHRKAEVVRLRYMEGLSLEEVAEQMGTSVATVKRDWTVARAWLAAALKS